MTIEAVLERIAVALERIADREYADVDEARREGERAGIETGKMLTGPDAVTTEKPKRGRPRKTATVEVTAAAPALTQVATAVTAPVEDPFIEDESTTVVEAPAKITADDIRLALTGYTNAVKDRAKAKELLAKFGNGAESIPGSPAAIKGGVKVLEEAFYQSVYDGILAAQKALVSK